MVSATFGNLPIRLFQIRRPLRKSGIASSRHFSAGASARRRPFWIQINHPIERKPFRKSARHNELKETKIPTAIYAYKRKQNPAPKSNLSHQLLLIGSEIGISRIQTRRTVSATETVRLRPFAHFSSCHVRF